ncbi:universal stress protein [Pseudomonas stutzeri]|uniref:universal stress protein n=1 Tax=Stutzerimonas stutzeri TaxID=316 RepID=UPI00210CC4FF|nr:universal stress protein [Stutzerimonas stutzeri]MCQ4309905.1 universal stress protein [Stutzerimonas stutzeri]
MRNILLAFDGSDNAKRALRYIVDFAADAPKPLQVHVLNAQQEPVIYGEFVTASTVEDLNKSFLEKSHRTLEQAATELQAAGIPHQTHAVLGDVAAQVNTAVQQFGCDTVVMGTRGLGSFTGMLLGSVANRVVHEVSVPVLLVK